MKRILSLSLALVLALCLCVPALAADFSDVPATHTFYSAVMDCAGKGIVGGYSDGTFRPANTVTRSNFSVMLSRAFYAGEVAANQIPLYTEQGKFYPNYMALYLNGIYKGTDMAGKNTLQSSATMNIGISRYEMAQLMTNIMKQKGFAASDSEKSAAVSKINDYDSIPSQFQDAVANVYALGIIGGYSDGSFSGSGIMNRGQACVVIYRMMQYSGNTSSGSVATPAPEAPAGPVATATGKLSDGSEATEANVMRLLEEAYQAKAGTPWGYLGTDGTPTGPIDTSKPLPYANGISSTLYATITNGTRRQYGSGLRLSVQAACGGFAAYLSDYVFGQKATVSETTLDKMRAGDIIVHLQDNAIWHVEIYCGHTNTGYNLNGQPVTAYNTYSSNAGSNPTHSTQNAFTPNDGIYKAGGSTTGKSYVIYTRYPDFSSGNTSSGSVITPAPETPVEPISTTAGTGTLSDGSEATEANVMRLLEEAYQAKAGTPWGNYNQGVSSTLYNAIQAGPRKGTGGLPCSVTGGCGGFAAYLSDYVFGQKATVSETTLDKMRPGDIIVYLQDNKIWHVAVYCGHTNTGSNINGQPVTAYNCYSSNAGSNPTHSTQNAFTPNDGIYKAGGSTTGKSYVIYTRYPD